MIVTNNLNEIKDILTGTCLTIGNFDGVHLGHRKLLGSVRELARAKGLTSLAMTFEPHPRRVLLGKNDPPMLTTLEVKLEIISSLGLDICLVYPFTRGLAAMEPENFVGDCLVSGLKMRELVIGHDWSFGKARRGDYATLSALGLRLGYAVERLGPVLIGDAVVSSTRIRDMLRAGDVWDAKELLGRFHKVRGQVVHGAGRGAGLLGFPTANLAVRDQLLPMSGVYAAWVSQGDKTWASVANIGQNPTFDGDHLSIEAHILDFSQDIYGQTVDLHLVQRLRAEKKFSGPQELKVRIAEDVALARRILSAPEAGL